MRMMRGLSVSVCLLLISEAVFVAFSPRTYGHGTAWNESDHCGLNPKSLIYSLYDRAVNQEDPGIIPVHTFMRDVYLRMRAADESDESIAENTTFPEEPRVKGFIPITQDHSPRMKVVHMLFNLTGLRLLRSGWSSVSMVLTQRERKRASDSMQLELELDTGHNVVIVSYNVTLEPGDKRRRILDLSEPVGIVTKPLMSGHSACVLLRLTIRVFQAQGRPRHKNPNKLYRLDRKHDGALLVFYYNVRQSILQQPRKSIRKRRSPKQNSKLCSVHQYVFPFQKIGYDASYLLYPLDYTPNYCAGDCPAPLVLRKNNGQFKVTLYAFLKGKYHLYTNFNSSHLPLANCFPNDYLRMTILYRNKHTMSVDVMNLENAIVKSCQCA